MDHLLQSIRDAAINDHIQRRLSQSSLQANTIIRTCPSRDGRFWFRLAPWGGILKRFCMPVGVQQTAPNFIPTVSLPSRKRSVAARRRGIQNREKHWPGPKDAFAGRTLIVCQGQVPTAA
jgi:hypothetical protein